MRTFTARVIIDVETDYSKDPIGNIFSEHDIKAEYIKSDDSSLPILYIRKKDA